MSFSGRFFVDLSLSSLVSIQSNRLATVRSRKWPEKPSRKSLTIERCALKLPLLRLFDHHLGLFRVLDVSLG
jgi:hypothetical protein